MGSCTKDEVLKTRSVDSHACEEDCKDHCFSDTSSEVPDIASVESSLSGSLDPEISGSTLYSAQGRTTIKPVSSLPDRFKRKSTTNLDEPNVDNSSSTELREQGSTPVCATPIECFNHFTDPRRRISTGGTIASGPYGKKELAHYAASASRCFRFYNAYMECRVRTGEKTA